MTDITLDTPIPASTSAAVRPHLDGGMGPLTLILFLGMPERNELYHLAKDPGEQANVFGREGTGPAVKELTAKLRTHMEAIKDPALPLLAAEAPAQTK